MENFVKHFHWGAEKVGGRVAVVVQWNELTIRQLSGSALPVEFLPSLLKAAFDKETLEAANELHSNRKNPFVVQVRTGMSGCRDYFLRPLQDEVTRDAPIKGRLHVSMAGKLNEDVRMWLGDLPPIFRAMQENREFRLSESQVDIWFDEEGRSFGRANVQIQEVPVFNGDFCWPTEHLVLGEDVFAVCEDEEEDLYDDDGDPKYLEADTLARLRRIEFEEDES